MHIKYIAPITAAVALMGTSAMAQETGGWYVQGDLGGSTGGQMDADAPIDLDSKVDFAVLNDETVMRDSGTISSLHSVLAGWAIL